MAYYPPPGYGGYAPPMQYVRENPHHVLLPMVLLLAVGAGGAYYWWRGPRGTHTNAEGTVIWNVVPAGKTTLDDLPDSVRGKGTKATAGQVAIPEKACNTGVKALLKTDDDLLTYTTVGCGAKPGNNPKYMNGGLFKCKHKDQKVWTTDCYQYNPDGSVSKV